jgi:predicted amidohydrolase
VNLPGGGSDQTRKQPGCRSGHDRRKNSTATQDKPQRHGAIGTWLNREGTLAKVKSYAEQAAREGCQLITFGEALVPGYPFWLEHTDGARFNSRLQKEIFAEYAAQAIQPEAGHLDDLRVTAARHHIAIYVGCVEQTGLAP